MMKIKKGFGIVPVNIDKDLLLLISILIIWFFVAITLKIYPIGIVVYIVLLSPLFAIGLFLSKRNAIVAGTGFFIGFYIKQIMCFHQFGNLFENLFHIIFIPINPFNLFHIIFILMIFVGISISLFTSIIGNKLNIKQFRSIWVGIIGFVVIFVTYYFMFTCGMS